MADNARSRTLDDEFDFDAGDLTKQFEQLLRTRRLNELEEQARTSRASSPHLAPRTSSQSASSPFPQSPNPVRSSRPAQPQSQPQQPPTYTSFRSHPIVPCPPQDALSLKFRNLLITLSMTPTKYENPGLLDDALTHVPIDQIYTEAEEEHNLMVVMAESKGDGSKPEWGYQDCVIRTLLRWFKRSFFAFVNNPPCTRCHGATVAQGQTPPTPDEVARGATRVELYRCTTPGCSAFERFPRYSDVWTLLETRRGRAGEFANCFSMLCRAAGARVRWVWNSEDHVWTEIYSEHQRRWVHVDPCEELWDTPRVYTEGWNRKIGYCIAFSSEGATDVTRRYVRNSRYQLPRNRCTEEVLLWIMHEIRKIRRDNMDKPVQARLRREDEREERELRGYVATSLADDMLNSIPGTTNPQRGEDVKTPAERQQEAAVRWSNQQQMDQSGRR
ncbi:peptide-N4-(N-acetyl-beta-glucosaminyl)asparagine amidase [Exophiala viscosa]|uniref:Peptide-N4-(N-acetyl-beta-glucosaminyl)asparagine amidase n=1 Tax=Exophiala viscosa TaxID=2486360 RepID=A0AAN6DVZ4_9EURO|nr:peptide-N4-(N-acetyl-beta-glucosaminyl)asparagine amidase [Exophiala viscosa]